jgi:4'-phosphopantetheinyl transferase
VDASKIRLVYGLFGKPSIAWPKSDIAFNLSHANNIALCAVARGMSVGIDLEQIRPMTELTDLVSRFFSAEEISDFRELPRDLREYAFFSCWTRKEAYVKAVGFGLAIPLNSFQVSLCPGQPPVLVHIGGNRLAAKSWSLHHFEPRIGVVAALAYPSRPRVVRWIKKFC